MNRTSLLFIIALATPASAEVISWNYDRYGTVTGTSTAGVVSVANWNNSWPANPVTNLINSDGNSTTLDLAYTSLNTWSIQGSGPALDGDGSSNKRLLNGYLNAGPAGWNPPITSSSVVLSQIPSYTSYDVIVYFSADAADREGTVTDGTTTYYFKTLGPASISGSNAVLTQATDTTATGYTIGANYAVFSGLTGNSKTITVQMRDNDEWGGIAGFQVNGVLPSLPEFSVQPQNTSAFVAQTATLTATAVSDPAPTYQWEFSADGNDPWTVLENETAASLQFSSVQSSNAGYYRVIATNTAGSVTSDEILLTVSFADPIIYQQPAGAHAQEGTDVTLSVVAGGYGNLTFQWFKGNAQLTGETSDTLILTSVDSNDAGDYTVEITDDAEPGLTTLSSIATVHVFPAWSGLESHDPFDITAGYAPGDLPAQNPTIAGYQGAWADVDFGDAEAAVTGGSLSYSDPLYLGSSGDKLAKAADAAGITGANSGRTYRMLEPAQVVASNTSGVRYLSWLYQNGNENAAANATTHSTLALYQNTGGANPSGDAALRTFSAGISDADYGTTGFAYRINDSIVGNLNTPIDSGVHLIVAKFDLSATAASDSITVWIDPDLGSGEPAGGVTLSDVDLRFDSLALSDYSSNSMAWDEIRWGSSFDSVTLNPNPSNTYASWISGYPAVGLLTGFNDDADGDGIDNGLENLFGTDPAASSQGIVQIARTGNTVTFQHPQNANPASDVSAAYEWSADLATFHADGASNGGTTVSFTASPNTPLAGTTTVTATITGTVPVKFFVRLKALKTP